jgi:DNA transformation protein and related proteins
MPLSPGFPDFVVELIAGFGKLEVKRMFGGASLSRDGVGFAILDDDVFFIKADAAFAAELKAQGCKPWVYSVKKDGSIRDIGYWSLPDTAADDPDEAVGLVRRSFAIAKQAAKDKPKKDKPKKVKKPAAKAAKPSAKAPAAKKSTPKPRAKK